MLGNNLRNYLQLVETLSMGACGATISPRVSDNVRESVACIRATVSFDEYDDFYLIPDHTSEVCISITHSSGSYIIVDTFSDLVDYLVGAYSSKVKPIMHHTFRGIADILAMIDNSSSVIYVELSDFMGDTVCVTFGESLGAWNPWRYIGNANLGLLFVFKHEVYVNDMPYHLASYLGVALFEAPAIGFDSLEFSFKLDQPHSFHTLPEDFASILEGFKEEYSKEFNFACINYKYYAI